MDVRPSWWPGSLAALRDGRLEKSRVEKRKKAEGYLTQSRKGAKKKDLLLTWLVGVVD